MKKKFITMASVLAIIMMSSAAMALEPSNLVFTQNENGKYIYCNNHELIRNTDLADNTIEKPRYIMNNEGLTPDNYALFASFLNRTDTDTDGGFANERGFDIEVDVMFKAVEETQITITALGFEVPEHRDFYLDGTKYSSEDEWGCFSCWATYLGMPIRQLNSGNVYDPLAFKEITFTIKPGETRWISEFIPNYREIPFCRSVNIMSDFTINSGKCDVNIAAFRTVEKVGDRSRLSKYAAYGSYYRDKQYKGISDGLNEVTTKLSYTIDDSDASGIKLPVNIYNQYVPEGKTVEKWYTHLNPRADEWSYELCAESDMLSFKYYDPQKLEYYGNGIKDEDKTPYYIFDTKHTDISEYNKSYGNEKMYIPNRELTTEDGSDIACNLGNYGVIYNYDLTLTNNGNKQRYVTYQLATSSNNLVYLKDSDGNVIDDYVLSKGRRTERVTDNMACITVPAMSTVNYTVCVVLTPNYAGGMENSFILTDYPVTIETYETQRSGITKNRYFTGREYYKWENGKLFLTDDYINWHEVSLPTSVTNDIKGNEREFTLSFIGDGYSLRPSLYDAGVYSHANGLFRDVYVLDENFNQKYKYTFGGYPEGFVSSKGTYFVQTSGTVFRNAQYKWWDLVYETLPCWNYGVFSAVSNDGTIKLSCDGINFNEVVYKGFKPDYIDSYGYYYYYVDGRALYLSSNGIYWRSMLFNSKVSSFEVIDSNVIVNGNEKQPLPEFNDSIYIKISDKYLSFENEPFVKNGTTYVPLREIAEYLGCKVVWDNGEITVSNDKSEYKTTSSDVLMIGDISYIPIRTLSESLGYLVEYDNANNICTVE